MAILVTGGAGYIGSHVVLALLNRGDNVVVLDNLSNASPESIQRIAKLTGKTAVFLQGDVRDYTTLQTLFSSHKITSVIHFAGLKAVGESVEKPLEYYQNNVSGTLTLLQAMHDARVNQLIFSSSATVYGSNAPIPYMESWPIGDTSSPYGASKAMTEQILNDYTKANASFRVIALRYFNPVGAHESGEIGEDPRGIPNNLLPYIMQVALGRRDKLTVFGSDYPTRDGTGERDYIHVMDVAEGHLCALAHMDLVRGYKAYNLGSGTCYSVMEVIKAFERASGCSIPYQTSSRREGDLAAFWADISSAHKELGWHATRNLEMMMRDAWNWQHKNPLGYVGMDTANTV